MSNSTKKIMLTTLLTFVLAVSCQRTKSLELQSSTMGHGHLLLRQGEFKEVADWLKSSVQNVPRDQLGQNIKRHCMRLKLIDREGQWKINQLRAHQERICPTVIKLDQLNSLIDESAYNLQFNPMLGNFLKQAKGSKISRFQTAITTKKDLHVGELVTWAYVLEQITALELEDPKNLRLLHNHWTNQRRQEGFKLPKNITDVFGTIKLASVEKPIVDLVSFFDKCRPLDSKFAQGFLPLNIGEAIIADRLMGHKENSEAGKPLFDNKPGDATNTILGTGPATFSKDGRKIEIRMSLPKQWADLYQVWNMAFVSQVGDAPFWWVKLMIPSVSAYKDAPEEYIYRRVLALYTSMIHGGLLSDEYNEGRLDRINWTDNDLTNLWGVHNKRASDSYKTVLETARKDLKDANR